jgi:deoxyinosine 3'endonuclease (endonuclease V)
MMPCTTTDRPQQQDCKSKEWWGAQKEIWKLEQNIIASLVHINPEPALDQSVIGDNLLFHLVRDDHHDIFSFSSKPELYGGVDVSFPESDNERAVAVYVIIDKRSMEVVYHDHEYFRLQVPYIKSFLAFREIEPLELMIKRQKDRDPDMTPLAILVDGNGILHARHAGIACFLGVRTGIPTIGVGKKLYYEAGWTRENLAENLDDFLGQLHKTIGSSEFLAPQLSRYRGLIMKKTCSKPFEQNATTCIDRPSVMKDLASFCNGIGIKLSGDSDRFPVLACALVGHGGQIAASATSQPTTGTQNPIFISVGHKISLQRAVQICASLSMARIPEPVRQADLMGRNLLRKRPHSNSSNNG